MSWRTNTLALGARNVGRKLGINSWIASFVLGEGYEKKYDESFSDELKAGSCVWDVGANVGYYTHAFAKRVGEKGVVFAFEPSPLNFIRLKEACVDKNNIKLFPVGLGRDNSKLCFQQGADDLGATSRVVDTLGQDQVEVDIRSGSHLIEHEHVTPPNAMKIDVEGFELEVLEGLGEYLGCSTLYALGIEIHFSILKERGMLQAPQQIEHLLERHGFVVRWVDTSHIIALRS